jgi:hypothetical protein
LSEIRLSQSKEQIKEQEKRKKEEDEARYAKANLLKTDFAPQQRANGIMDVCLPRYNAFPKVDIAQYQP